VVGTRTGTWTVHPASAELRLVHVPGIAVLQDLADADMLWCPTPVLADQAGGTGSFAR
jgi:hypothetical protein